MEKIMRKFWVVIVLVMLIGTYVYGYHKMFFHQDDLDWFILANRPFLQVMTAPIGDHINYVFRILLSIEWSVFKLYFPGYLMISVLMHMIVIYLLYILVKLTTGRQDLSIASALLFTVNTNWTEVVLWISGQTISITVIFVLLAMISFWRKKHLVVTIFLAGWTSALALGLPIALATIYGYTLKAKMITKVGLATIGSLLLTVAVYLTKATDGTKLEMSIGWGLNVVIVSVLMVINTVIGRLFLPFDRFEMVRIILTIMGLLIVVYLMRKQILAAAYDKWSLFLSLQIAIYYLVVAVGRAQYGIGIMRAERYGYLGLVLIILLVARIIRNTKVRPLILVVPLVVLQIGGFYWRANSYVGRPAQLKQLVDKVELEGFSAHNSHDFLPHFVLNDERLTYGDLEKLMKD